MKDSVFSGASAAISLDFKIVCSSDKPHQCAVPSILNTPRYEFALAQRQHRQPADPGLSKTRSPLAPYSTLTSI
jgi:hypothetical protein